MARRIGEFQLIARYFAPLTKSFKGAPHKLKAFYDKYPKAFGPLANL